MKKLMILGGSENQLPLILTAKNLGLYVVLCDYSEENVGREHCDAFYCVSTLDRNAVLEVAKKEAIDGVVTNSEPAMPISAYVGNTLGLPSNPYESILTLSRKDLFRKFLRSNGFACPQSVDVGSYDEAINSISGLRFPLMVKPVDSSGSRGVSRIKSISELRSAFDEAMGFSKMKRVMVEEYIKRTHDYMIGGDIFVLNGKVAFWGLMNSFRNRKISEFIPVGTSFPTLITPEQFGRVSDLVHEVIGVLNIQSGPFNLEMMFGEDGNLYMIEMNPRSGGNQIPEILKVATGVNLVEATVRAALGEGDIRFDSNKEQKFMSTYVLHSSQSGVLEGVNIHEAINKYVINVAMHKQLGDTVNKFENAGELVGVVLMEFPSLEKMLMSLGHIDEFINVSLNTM